MRKGRIIIAIIGIFIVLFAILGFTYAYFIANITGNNSTKSVVVNAGYLQIDYTSSRVLSATALIPGWASDGLSYYDPSYRDNNGHITAKRAANKASVPSNAIGVSLPATFTVTNTSSASMPNVYYGIKLTNISNNMVSIGEANTTSDDRKNLQVTLYKGTCSDAASCSGTPIFKQSLNASGSQVIVKTAETIATKGETASYYIIVNYLESNANQSQNMGKSFSATVEVFGLGRSGNSYYESGSNTAITFPTSLQI